MKTTIKIIIVDDDPDEILQLQDVLHQNGFDQLRYFNNPEEILCYLKDEADCELPKTLAPDVDMQRVSGYEFIQSLKRNSFYRSVAVLVSSTSTFSGYLYLFQQHHLLRGLA